jgi:plastocyanin
MRLLILIGALIGCHAHRSQPPSVQFSSDQPASRVVTVTRLGNFSPPCIVIATGDTVEWDNPGGNPINVTTASVRGKPPELYSPSLVGSAAMWRHTFLTPGRYDYFNQGGGAAAVDPYYGTRTGGGSIGAQGTICVRESDGSGCGELCCDQGGPPEQCGGGLCEIPDDPQITFGFCGKPTVTDGSTD